MPWALTCMLHGLSYNGGLGRLAVGHTFQQQIFRKKLSISNQEFVGNLGGR